MTGVGGLRGQGPELAKGRTRMATRSIGSVTAAVLMALTLLYFAGATPSAQGQARAIPRTADGKPNLQGMWQVVNSANDDLEPHSAAEGISGGIGVVEGGAIPYLPAALAKRNENRANRKTADPVSKCFIPGVPRVTYMPWPFQIIQTPKYMVISYEFAHTQRIIYTDGSPHVEALDFWMGDSRARWEGDTLVVDVKDLNDKTWFDNAGNYHSDQLHVVERYSFIDADHLNYEATIEDPQVFSRPWKISMPIYRRLEPNLQVIEYDCVSYFWQKFVKPSTP
jgi:hypothetical protein